MEAKLLQPNPDSELGFCSLHREAVIQQEVRMIAEEPDILAALPPSLRSYGGTSARRSRKVAGDFCPEKPRALPGATIFTPPGFRNAPAAGWRREKHKDRFSERRLGVLCRNCRLIGFGH
jgi:hypothetical protein